MTDDFPLSEERRAFLAPKLAALLADLGQLRDLETPGLEPASAWPWPDDDDGGGDAR